MVADERVPVFQAFGGPSLWGWREREDVAETFEHRCVRCRNEVEHRRSLISRHRTLFRFPVARIGGVDEAVVCGHCGHRSHPRDIVGASGQLVEVCRDRVLLLVVRQVLSGGADPAIFQKAALVCERRGISPEAFDPTSPTDVEVDAALLALRDSASQTTSEAALADIVEVLRADGRGPTAIHLRVMPIAAALLVPERRLREMIGL